MHAFRLAWLLMASASVLAIIPAVGLGIASDPALPELLPAASGRRTRTIPGFEQRELVLRGSRVAFSVGGDGPPVVLVHGLLDDSLTWRRIAPKLARRYTVIVPDLAGHGRSGPASHGDYGPGGHALVLRDLLDALGWGRVALVGHSLGGAVALTFAAQNPDRLARLALISPGGFGREVHRMLRFAAAPGGGLGLALITSAPTRWCLDRVAWGLAHAGLGRAGAQVSGLSEFLAGLAPAHARQAFLRSNAAVINRRGQIASATGWIDAWRGLPTLVLWGSADGVIPVEHAFTLAEAHPEAEVVLLDGVGHLAHRERPTVVADRLLGFLDQGGQLRPRTDAGAVPVRVGGGARLAV
jgi:pimeloyl-ACP methyl ester carboxylesterase